MNGKNLIKCNKKSKEEENHEKPLFYLNVLMVNKISII